MTKLKKLTGYDLSRNWFNYMWENPDKVTTNHTALYCWCMELWNRLGQPGMFTLPASEAMRGMSCKRYATFKQCFEDLAEWGFIEITQRSKNIYTANCIRFVQNVQSTVNALDKALSMQSQSTVERVDKSTVHINKPETINHEPLIIKIGNDVFNGTAWEYLGTVYECTAQVKALLKIYPAVVEDDLIMHYREKYPTGFNDKKHAINSIRSAFKEIQHERSKENRGNNSRRNIQSVGSGVAKDFTDGHSVGS